MGYDGVELRRTQVHPGTPKGTLDELKRILADHGLTVTGLIARGLPDESPIQDWPGVFQRFRAAGYDGLITVVESGRPVERRPEIARRAAAAVRRMWEDAQCASR